MSFVEVVVIGYVLIMAFSFTVVQWRLALLLRVTTKLDEFPSGFTPRYIYKMIRFIWSAGHRTFRDATLTRAVWIARLLSAIFAVGTLLLALA